MNFGFKQPNGFRGEGVCKCCHTTHIQMSEAYLSYKLTTEPKCVENEQVSDKTADCKTEYYCVEKHSNSVKLILKNDFYPIFFSSTKTKPLRNI